MANENIRIRPMTEEDVPGIAFMENLCFTDPWSQNAFRDSLKEPSATLLVIVKDEKEFLGYACLYVVLDEGEIVNVAIHPEARQKGYGIQLVKALIEEGRRFGARRFFLEVREGNTAGRKLYTALGFEKTGIRKGFYEHPKEDAVLMSIEYSQ